MRRLRWLVALCAILVSATACGRKQSQDIDIHVGAPTAPSTHTATVSLEADRNTISLNACPGIVALAVTITPSSASQVVTWEWVGPREGVEKTEGAKTFQLSSRQAGVHHITAVHASGARSNTVRVEFIGSCGSGSAAPGAFTLNEGTCSATGFASISWTASAGATHYRIERRTWSTGAWITVGSTTSREFSQQVGRDADHYFRVVAVGNGGETLSSPSEKLVCQTETAPPPPPGPLAQCRDGVDNDGDGKIDYPADPGCSSPDDNSEVDPVAPPPPPPPPPVPTVTLTANPTTVPQHGASQLTATVANVTSCTKTGDWSGTLTISGSSSVVLSEVRTYTFGLTCTGPGGTASASATITVTAPGCPTSISYEVVGGGGNTVAVNQNKSLRVVNWTANSACKPFWYVSDASRAMVIGADEAIVIDGATYYAGVNGLIRGVWPGTVQVCVQTSITANNTKDCKTWTVTVSSSSSTMSAEDTPQLKYMNRADFAQTFSGLVVIWQF